MPLLLPLSFFCGFTIPYLAAALLQRCYKMDFQKPSIGCHLLMGTLMFVGNYFFWRFHTSANELYPLFMWLYLLLFAALTDYWAGLIPNLCTYTALLIGMLFVTFDQPQQLGAIAFRVAICFFLLSSIASWTAALGGGDVKLITGASIFLSPALLCFGLWLASVSALGWLLVRWLEGHPFSRKMKIAFAPHLAAGFYLASLCELIW